MITDFISVFNAKELGVNGENILGRGIICHLPASKPALNENVKYVLKFPKKNIKTIFYLISVFL